MAKTAGLSLGGGVVNSSLHLLGYEKPPDVSLVETALPARRAWRVVLVQSAWNVLPGDEFRAGIGSYPPRMRARMMARRAAAWTNISRADRVVALSHTMADWTSERFRRDVEVCPVHVPLDLAETRRECSSGRAEHALVPGTLTWYKRPGRALEVALQEGITSLLFAGRDDGSGCWGAVDRQARHLGLSVHREALPRERMLAELRRARLVILPTALESLSLSFGEAALLANDLLASRIPAHVELSGRLGVDPRWIEHGTEGTFHPLTDFEWAAEVVRWRSLAHALL